MNANSVLFIDPNAATIKQARVTLEFESFDVLSASNAEDGLKMAVETKPMLVIAAVTMPGMTGYDLCRRIRRLRKLEQTRVILTSSSMDVYDAPRAARVGASAHLNKPFLPSQLIAMLTEVMMKEVPVLDESYDEDSMDEPASLEADYVSQLGASSDAPPTGDLPLNSIEFIEDSGEFDDAAMAFVREVKSAARSLDDDPGNGAGDGDLNRLIELAVNRYLDQHLPGLIAKKVDEALKKRKP